MQERNSLIYLDYNATAPPKKEIVQKALECYLQNFANSSGRSLFSQKVRSIIDEIRLELANYFLVTPERIIFTSSASESNALLLNMFISSVLARKKTCNILLSPFEHPSIYETVSNRASVSLRYISCYQDNKGSIDFEALEELLQQQSFDIVICMHIHNETGILLPVMDIESLLLQYVKETTYFLCDCVQSLAKWDKATLQKESQMFLRDTDILKSFFVFSGHKIGAAFGTSMIILPKQKYFIPDEYTKYVLYRGGSQENSLRSGTHNLCSILAFKYTIEVQLQQLSLFNSLCTLTKKFEQKLSNALETITSYEIIGSRLKRYPGTTMLLLPKVDIDCLFISLDQQKIIVSTGTSCKSHSRTASLGLQALGYSEDESLHVLRLSYHLLFSEEEQDRVISVLEKAIPLHLE